MKLVKEAAIIFGVTMVGELLYTLLPLPVPAGVYGLFLLLFLLFYKASSNNPTYFYHILETVIYPSVECMKKIPGHRQTA